MGWTTGVCGDVGGMRQVSQGGCLGGVWVGEFGVGVFGGKLLSGVGVGRWVQGVKWGVHGYGWGALAVGG